MPPSAKTSYGARCVKYIKDREQYKCGWLIGVASVSCDKNATWCRPMWVERTTTTKRRTNFVLPIQWDGSQLWVYKNL